MSDCQPTEWEWAQALKQHGFQEGWLQWYLLGSLDDWYEAITFSRVDLTKESEPPGSDKLLPSFLVATIIYRTNDERGSRIIRWAVSYEMASDALFNLVSWFHSRAVQDWLLFVAQENLMRAGLSPTLFQPEQAEK